MNNQITPLITIGLTTYNRLNFLKESVQSVLNQKYKNLPVINGSLNNPHIAYDFNINPKSRLEYRSILMLDHMAGYYGQFTSQLYNYWIEHWSKEKHEEILSMLSKFIDANWYHLEPDSILSN